jgi:protein O-mannosyl-transferase
VIMFAKTQAGTVLPPRALLGAAIIFLAAWFCYYPSLSGGFLWDDDRLLTESRIIKSPDGLHRIWCSTEAVDFWPVTNTLLWTQWRLWGMDPAGYRVTNLITHAAAALLIWIILQRLSISGAFLAAMIFAVHPVNVESVAWITQQDNTLALLFFLLSILWYLKALRCDGAPREGEQSRPLAAALQTRCPSPTVHCQPTALSSFIPHLSSFYWLSLAGFALAMLGKGSAAVLPVVLLGIVWWRRKVTRWDVARSLPFFAIAAILVVVNIWFQTHGSGEEFRTAGFLERVLGAGGVIWFYLYKAVLPINLAYVYPQWEIQTGRVLWWLPLLAALTVTAVLWWYREKWSWPFLFAWGFFCVSLAPVMGFTDVEYMECSLVANHYQYIAIIGVISLAAAGCSLWRRQIQGPVRWAGGGAVVILVITLMVLSWQQSRLYSDAILLYQASLETNPRSYIVHNNLGMALKNAGRPNDAAEQFQRAVDLKPDYFAACNNLAVVLNNLGRTQDAIKLFQHVLLQKPDYPEALNNLGAALIAAGRPEEAEKFIEKALRLKPDYAKAHYHLGIALSEIGRQKEAVEHFKQALSLKPDYAEAHNSLGVLLGQAGLLRDATEHFRQALHYDPKMFLAENNLGNTLSGEGKSDEAVEHYEQALRLKPDYLQARVSLAGALVKAGMFPKAIEHYEQALRLKPDCIEAYFGLALTYAKTKQTREAAAIAQKALELARTQGRMEVAGKIEDWLRSYRADSSE